MRATTALRSGVAATTMVRTSRPPNAPTFRRIGAVMGLATHDGPMTDDEFVENGWRFTS